MDLDISARPHPPMLKPLNRNAAGAKQAMPFNSTSILSGAGDGSATLQCRKQQILFTQGDAANAVFYIVDGWVKLTVVSRKAKKPSSRCWKAGIFSVKPVSPGSGYVRRPPPP